MVMEQHLEVLGIETEIVEECLVWTLQLHINYRLLTLISRKGKNTW